MAGKWAEREQEMRELILHDGWLQVDLAEYYGVTSQRIQQVVHELGIPFSPKSAVQLWCPWPPTARHLPGYCSKPIADCPHTERKHAAKGKCRACYQQTRLRDPEKWRHHQAIVVAGGQRRKATTRLLDGRWSRGWSACRECRTTERAHFGHGYCSRCYSRLYQCGAIKASLPPAGPISGEA